LLLAWELKELMEPVELVVQPLFARTARAGTRRRYATSYLLGVSTRRVEKLAESLGVTKLSKSQVSVMAAELDEMVAGFRNRRLDGAPYAFIWVDAPTQEVREGGRTVNVHALIATGVSAEGKREILLGRCWACTSVTW
jgi:transposase-like protein